MASHHFLVTLHRMCLCSTPPLLLQEPKCCHIGWLMMSENTEQPQIALPLIIKPSELNKRFQKALPYSWLKGKAQVSSLPRGAMKAGPILLFTDQSDLPCSTVLLSLFLCSK